MSFWGGLAASPDDRGLVRGTDGRRPGPHRHDARLDRGSEARGAEVGRPLSRLAPLLALPLDRGRSASQQEVTTPEARLPSFGNSTAADVSGCRRAASPPLT